MSETPNTSGRSRRFLAAAVVALVILAWVAVAIAILFLDLSMKQRVWAVAGAAFLTEGALYVGGVYLGISFLARIRGWLWPRFGARDPRRPTD